MLSKPTLRGFNVRASIAQNRAIHPILGSRTQRSTQQHDLVLKKFSKNQRTNWAMKTRARGGLLAILGALLAFGYLQDSEAEAQSEDIYSLTAKDINGKEVKLSQFKGQVLLIVNVACNCGYTHKNYTELVQLHNKYKGQGFQILAFPSNQFWGQEPGTNAEIQQFVKSKYGVEFMLFEKTDVNGPNAHPVYNFLKKASGDSSDIQWNFSKFLVDKNGRVFKRYPTSVNPIKIEEDIQSLLKK